MTNRKLAAEGRALTRQEAADALRVSLSTVDRFIKDGTLVANRVGKRLVRVNAYSVDALLSEEKAS